MKANDRPTISIRDNKIFLVLNRCDYSIQIKGSMAETDSYAGTFQMLFESNPRRLALRRGYQVWKHNTKDFFIYVGKNLKWHLSEKRYFDLDVDRNRDID